MRSITFALLAIPALATDLSIFCRLLQSGLSAVSNQPLVEDIDVAAYPSLFLLGTMNVSVGKAEFGSMNIRDCHVSVTPEGLFNVALVPLELQFRQFAWQYEMERWPHFADAGVGAGSMTSAFNVTIDMQKEEVKLAHLELDFINMDLGATRHPWLTKTLMSGIQMMRPVISAVLGKAFPIALADTISYIKTKGGCVFLENALSVAKFAELSFTSVVPVKVHVPAIGDIGVSVNSTYVKQPTRMNCKSIGFNGASLEADIEDVPFSAGFNWAYGKPGSWLWHNRGSGTVDVVAGTAVHINVLHPEETAVAVKMPALYLNFQAESHNWLYGALSYVMGPLVRESLQLFGGKIAEYEIKRCIADPQCPRPFSSTKVTVAVVQEPQKATMMSAPANKVSSDLVVV